MARVSELPPFDLGNLDGRAQVPVTDGETLGQAPLADFGLTAKMRALLGEVPDLFEFDLAADIKRGIYFDQKPDFRLQRFEEMFIPRLPLPAPGSGLYLPAASANLAHTGLNETDTANYIANANLNITIIERGDLSPSDLAELEALEAAENFPWPIERVFRIENPAASGNQNFQAQIGTGVDATNTASAYVFGISGSVRVSTGASPHGDAAPLGTWSRLESTGTGTTVQLRCQGPSVCYAIGLMLQAGAGPALPHSDGFQILNRLRLRDRDVIKPNGILVMQFRLPQVRTSGGDTIFSVFSPDRTKTVKLSANWSGSAFTLSANDGVAVNNANIGFASWDANLPIRVACRYSKTGQLGLSVDRALQRTQEAINQQTRLLDPGNVLDLSGIDDALFGGNMPNASEGSGTPFSISPLYGEIETLLYKGWN